MQLIEHIKYKKNRFLSYYFLDFTLRERIILLKNIIKNNIKYRKKKVFLQNYNPTEVKVFVISLKKRVDRQEHINKEMRKNNLSFSFFIATDGENLDATDNQYITRRSKINLSKGSIGCAISHIRLWELISKQTADNLCIIFEDDIILKDNFSEIIDNLLNEIPANFDLILLGGYNNRKRDIHYFVNNNLFRSYNPRRGLYGYIINKKSAEKLLKLIKPFDLLYGGIDTKIGKLTRKNKLNVYQVYPSIVEINYSFSSNIFNYSERNKKKLYEQAAANKKYTAYRK